MLRREREAIKFLRWLLSQYPRSPYMLRARYLLARAFWLQSEGPDYDERTLLASRRGFEDFVGTARLLKRENEVKKPIRSANRMIGVINGRLAQKQYRIGRFYERAGHPESALPLYLQGRRRLQAWGPKQMP